ncbi:hypothetical protein CANCADRAFT_97122 [Tortispora caseinolytica NRRL Y-17796]|uniref:Endoribonuclease YSH1 n=1 Tax=Tortispora caseinolytica NRRL Y-17796 TaxID=767744 RepID=A0A1E4TDQ2_9ASCO|nr:hypothetical protein CANCADRAFT_97122 [Tortispora caseinolytica NRRL Y-17796]
MTVVETSDGEVLEFIALGGGNEVGRSCHIIKYNGKTIMLDAGVHPAHTGLACLPFYDEFDMSTIDILLISHFHLDHAASLPYVMQHTAFKGRVFMTHPTKAIYRWLLSDFVRVSSITPRSSNAAPVLFTDSDLQQSFDKIEPIDYHSTIDVDGVRFTAYHAGHVLGAAMYFIELGGLKLLFTGDYSREEDRHLSAAEVPPESPDVLICESTFGTAVHLPRREKESQLMSIISSVIDRGGRVLLPTFALGRAQELLLVVNDYWKSHKSIQNTPVYFASNLAKKALTVYQTYTSMMNESIRKQFRDAQSNPFHFQYIKSLRSLDSFFDAGPCVMIASPGMLQSGTSRELLERWAPDNRNAVIITGYSVEGTLAKDIVSEPLQIPSMRDSSVLIPRRCMVEEISFAAHVDYKHNSEFIDLVKPKHIILVHGESSPMGRLKSALLSKYNSLKGTEQEIKIYNPRDCEILQIPFKAPKPAKVVGILAENQPKKDDTVSAIAVQRDFRIQIMDPSDLRAATGITYSQVIERQRIRVYGTPSLIEHHLQQMFGSVAHVKQEEYDTVIEGLEVMDGIIVWTHPQESYTLAVIEWAGNVLNDTIADSVLAVLMSVGTSPASLKVTAKSHKQSHGSDSLVERIDRLTAMLSQQFENVEPVFESGKPKPRAMAKIAEATVGIKVSVDEIDAIINFSDWSVESTSKALKSRVQHVLAQILETISPLSQTDNKV